MERQLQSESWDVICFGGEETLCLAKFAQQVTNNLATLSPYIVHVEGRYLKDNSQASVLGKLKESNKNINGYIRNIRVEDLDEQDEAKREKGLSVGCSNATMEDIAADRVSFFFFGEPDGRQDHILDLHYMYYAIRPTLAISEKDMRRYRASGRYLKAIAIAKRLGNDVAKDLLISYLRQEHPTSANMKEMAAEAFRSLEKLCKRDPNSSEQATDALISYINYIIKGKNAASRYRNSVIYAIEALGFVANHNEDQKVKVFKYLPELLSSCTREDFKDDPAIYWHIVWASLVTLLRTIPRELKTVPPNTAPFFTIKASLLDDDILAEVEPEDARSVIQKTLADFFIYSGIMTPDAYLLTYGLNEDDIHDMQIAGDKDKVIKTKRLGDNSEDWIARAAKKIAKGAENLTVAMATALAIGLMKSYLGVP
jgi:hypothetical protein